MELTWITFPTIVVTVSLVAYYAAYLLKGNDLLVNKVDVVDIDQTGGTCARPHMDQPVQPAEPRLWRFGRFPLPLDRDPPPDSRQHAEPPGRRAGTEVVTSWFSVPEDQFGAMGNSGRRFSFVGSGYAYEPDGRVEWLENVRIPIWSTKCITVALVWSRQPARGLRPETRGHDRLAGTVTNRSTCPSKTRSWLSASTFICWAHRTRRHGPGRTASDDRNLSGLLKYEAVHAFLTSRGIATLGSTVLTSARGDVS